MSLLITRRVSLVEHELLTCRCPWVQPRLLVGFMVLDLVCVCFVDRRLSFCPHDRCHVWSRNCYHIGAPEVTLDLSVVRVALSVDFYVMYGI